MNRTIMSLSLAFALAGGALAQGAMTEAKCARSMRRPQDH